MNYKQTILSSEDKDILDEIYQHLEKIHIPTTYRSNASQGHSVKTGTVYQKGARQTCFGITTYRGKKQISKSCLRYPHMMPLFKEFIDSHSPGFKFKTVYVNRNTVAKKHLDSKNTGESLLVGVGPYTKGQTTLYDENGSEKMFSIKSHSLRFNGSEIEHKSEGFEGIRYSLVFFN